jgi:N-methylhydantoinase A
VDLPPGDLTAANADSIRASFETEYAALYGRIIPGQEPEILSWTLTVSAPIVAAAETVGEVPDVAAAKPVGSREVFDPDLRETVDYAIYLRADLSPGMRLTGPALVVEDQTTTVVTSPFDLSVNGIGYLILTRTR